MSIGMVRDDGATCYAVVQDRDLTMIALTFPWLAANAIPSMPVAFREYPVSADRLWRWDTLHADYAAVRPRADQGRGRRVHRRGRST